MPIHHAHFLIPLSGRGLTEASEAFVNPVAMMNEDDKMMSTAHTVYVALALCKLKTITHNVYCCGSCCRMW